MVDTGGESWKLESDAQYWRPGQGELHARQQLPAQTRSQGQGKSKTTANNIELKTVYEW